MTKGTKLEQINPSHPIRIMAKRKGDGKEAIVGAVTSAVTPANAGVQLQATIMVEEKYPAVYMLANRYRGTVYVGVTSRLYVRVGEHKEKGLSGFTAKYAVDRLVWYEHHHTMEDAIRREKSIKAWKRAWKIKMIESSNPDWLDLHDSIDFIGTLHRPRASKSSELDPSIRWGDGGVGAGREHQTHNTSAVAGGRVGDRSACA